MVPSSFSPSWGPWLAGLTLFVLLAALVEGLVLSWRTRRGLGADPYDWRATAASLADVLGRRWVDGLGWSLASPVMHWAQAHRLATINLDSPWAWVGLFLGQELAYYAYHRAAHRVRWFWATHAVHHSSQQLTLAAALRLGWTGRLSGTPLFFAPLIWLGFDPVAVLGLMAFNLAYQFWLHAPWMPHLGPLEWLLNTPAHHRVHHGSNPEYLDCNYGGVLIVFDRLFGSFVAEQPGLPPRYGLATPLNSHNPVRIALHGWLALGQDLCKARSLRAALTALFGSVPGSPHSLVSTTTTRSSR